MQKIQKISNKKKIIVSLAILLVALLSLVAYLYIIGDNPVRPSDSVTDTNSQEAADAQKAAGDSTKKDTIEGSETQKPDQVTDNPSSPTPSDESGGREIINLSITSTNQEGTSLHIKTLISSVVNSGTCTLTLSKDGVASIVKTAAPYPGPTSSTCQGFDIALSDGLSPGSWNVDLVFENTKLYGHTTGSVVVN